MTFLIQVNTDQLLTTANMLYIFSDSLHLQQQRLGSQIQILTQGFYQGNAQQELTSHWEALVPQIQALTHQAENLSIRLQKLADRILEADNFFSTNVPNFTLQSQIWKYLVPTLGGTSNMLPIFSTLPGLPEDSYLRTGDAFSKVYGLLTELPHINLPPQIDIVVDLLSKHIDGESINLETIGTTTATTILINSNPKLKAIMLANDAVQIGGNLAIEGSEWLLEHTALSDEMRHEINRAANSYQNQFQAQDLGGAIESGVGLGVNIIASIFTDTDYSVSNQNYLQTLKDYGSSYIYEPEARIDYIATGAITTGARIATWVPGISDEQINRTATQVLREINDFNITDTVMQGAGSILSGGKNLLDTWI